MKRLFPLLLKIASCFSVLFTYAFLYLPILVLIAFSFNAKEFPAPWDHFTLHWYEKLFIADELWSAFLNSLIIASSSTFLSLLMGTLLIYLEFSNGKVFRFLPLFYANIAVPETVIAASLMGYFLLLKVPLGMTTLIVSHTLLGLAFVVPIIMVRYKELDTNLKEAALVLGASLPKTFFTITLPLMRPSLIASGALVFVISFDDFILSYFCSGTATQTLSLYLIASLRYGISPVVNALSTLLIAATALLVLFFFSPKRSTTRSLFS